MKNFLGLFEYEYDSELLDLSIYFRNVKLLKDFGKFPAGTHLEQIFFDFFKNKIFIYNNENNLQIEYTFDINASVGACNIAIV